MNPIGTYLFPAVQTPAFERPVYGEAPIFGTRLWYLPLVGRVMHQVLILAFGEYVWINVPARDVTLYEQED